MFILYSSKEQNLQKHVVLKNQWGSKEINKYLLGGSIDLIESSQKNFGPEDLHLWLYQDLQIA